MSKTKKTLIVAIVLIALVALAGTVVVFAHTLEDQINSPEAGAANEISRLEQVRQRVPGGANIDYDSLLADALGVTVEELQEARDEAFRAAVQQAVDEGYLAPRRADQILAVHTMIGLIDKGQLAADALGISVEELQEARQDQALRQLLDELEMTPADVREAVLEQFKEAVDEALDDGLLTEEQAEMLKDQPGLMLRDPREPPRQGAGRDVEGRGYQVFIRKAPSRGGF